MDHVIAIPKVKVNLAFGVGAPVARPTALAGEYHHRHVHGRAVFGFVTHKDGQALQAERGRGGCGVRLACWVRFGQGGGDGWSERGSERDFGSHGERARAVSTVNTDIAAVVIISLRGQARVVLQTGAGVYQCVLHRPAYRGQDAHRDRRHQGNQNGYFDDALAALMMPAGRMRKGRIAHKHS